MERNWDSNEKGGPREDEDPLDGDGSVEIRDERSEAELDLGDIPSLEADEEPLGVEVETSDGDIGEDDGIVYRPSFKELQAAAEIVVFLEDDLGLDVRRLHVRCVGSTVFIQGSVESVEQRRLIEESLPGRPGIQDLACSITVQEFD